MQAAHVCDRSGLLKAARCWHCQRTDVAAAQCKRKTSNKHSCVHQQITGVFASRSCWWPLFLSLKPGFFSQHRPLRPPRTIPGRMGVTDNPKRWRAAEHLCEGDPSWLGARTFFENETRDPSRCRPMYIVPLLLNANCPRLLLFCQEPDLSVVEQTALLRFHCSKPYWNTSLHVKTENSLISYQPLRAALWKACHKRLLRWPAPEDACVKRCLVVRFVPESSSELLLWCVA